MPYMIKKTSEGKYAVFKQSEDGKPMGSAMGTHEDRKGAEEQMKALYASENKGFTLIDSIMTSIKQFLSTNAGSSQPDKEQKSGFKVLPDGKWYAFWTNNAQDKMGEWFAEKAIDNYVERVNSGEVPYPALWYWHMPVMAGKAEYITKIDHVVLAVGSFNDDALGNKMRTYFERTNKQHSVSHGFIYPKSAFVDNTYHHFTTFEISPLPTGKEANAYTSFQSIKELETMPYSDDQVKALSAIVGEKEAQEILGRAEAQNKALEQAGVSFKDANQVAVQDEQARKEISELREVVNALKALPDALKTVLQDLAVQNKAQAQATTKVVSELEQQIQDLKSFVDVQFNGGQRASVDAATRIDQLQPDFVNQLKSMNETGGGQEAPNMPNSTNFFEYIASAMKAVK